MTTTMPKSQRSYALCPAVDRLVRAVCEDYDRRAALLRTGRAPEATLRRFRELNEAVDEGLAEACEPGLIPQMRSDIAARRGDRRSQLYYISPNTYRHRKRMSKLAIARNLGLI